MSSKSPSVRATSINSPEDGMGVALLPDAARDDETEAFIPKQRTDTEVEADATRTRNLVISFIAMVVIGLGNKVFQVLQFVPMYNYPLGVNLLTTFVYIPLSFLYIIPMLKFGKMITPEATAVPKYKFAVMGALDSLAGIMQSLSVNYIANGSLVTLLTQAAIPFSMVISKIFLRTKYRMYQLIGATIVAIGIIVALLPSLMDPSGSGHGSNRVAWSIVLILSCIPMCLSSVYKEKALGDTDIDAVYMNGWIAVFQFIIAIPLLFPSAIASNVKIKDLGTNLLDGAKCLARIDSVKNTTAIATNTSTALFGMAATSGVTALSSTSSTVHIDNCHEAPVYVTIYLCFNILYNILILLILKFGSSNILWLAMTVLVPLANFAFAFKFMPQPVKLTWENTVGLVLILIGLLAYRFWGSILKLWEARNAKKSDKTEPLLGSESPFMNTPMRGAGVHTTKKKPTVRQEKA